MQTCLHLKSLSYGQQGVTSPVSKRKPFDWKLMRKTALLLPWFITSVNSFLTGLCDCHNILSNYGHFLVQIRAVNKSSKFEHIFEYLKKQKRRFDCENEYWKHISGCFASGRTAWWVRDGSQELHSHSVTHFWTWDAAKTVADADGGEKNKMARKFRAQLGSRESGVNSKQPKVPRLEILWILVSRRQKCGASR